jgi:hypothetical protein
VNQSGFPSERDSYMAHAEHACGFRLVTNGTIFCLSWTATAGGRTDNEGGDTEKKWPVCSCSNHRQKDAITRLVIHGRCTATRMPATRAIRIGHDDNHHGPMGEARWSSLGAHFAVTVLSHGVGHRRIAVLVRNLRGESGP